MLESKVLPHIAMAKKLHARGHAVKTAALPNRCFACGPANPQGMHLKFYFDEAKRRAWCRFRLPRRYQGPPRHAHGGIIATVLDEAMGKVNKLRSVVALTKAMEIEYLKPVPLGQTLIAEGHERRGWRGPHGLAENNPRDHGSCLHSGDGQVPYRSLRRGANFARAGRGLR